ncbi:MAG: glycosyltransferase [Candidatus Obscuribacterales bacterium]|nr:glycosyltransferase [Candidatus Obscuribacterales bacterium]
MRLNDLPQPPTDKSGWPWTLEDESEMPLLPEYPRISIITPSYNQGGFVEETIRSVLLQNYPEIEYIVIDGNSKDQTQLVLDKYKSHFAFCSSEADSGQSEAINKGMRRATGALVAWLNSDDFYLPGTLMRVAKAYLETGAGLIAGPVINFRHGGEVERVIYQDGLNVEFLGSFHQPGIFFDRQLWLKIGGVDEQLDYCMDRDLLYRALALSSVAHLSEPLAMFRLHEQSKCERSGIFGNKQFELRQRLVMLNEDYLTLDRYGKISAKQRQNFARQLSHLTGLALQRMDLAFLPELWQFALEKRLGSATALSFFQRIWSKIKDRVTVSAHEDAD